MTPLIKGILIGVAIGAVVTGMFIPFGEENESVYDKIVKKEE